MALRCAFKNNIFILIFFKDLFERERICMWERGRKRGRIPRRLPTEHMEHGRVVGVDPKIMT